jgi:hypothetical protein
VQGKGGGTGICRIGIHAEFRLCADDDDTVSKMFSLCKIVTFEVAAAPTYEHTSAATTCGVTAPIMELLNASPF